MEFAGDNKYIGRIGQLTSDFGAFVKTINPEIGEKEKDRIVTAMEKFVESLQNTESSSGPAPDLGSDSTFQLPNETSFGKYDKFKGVLVEGQEGGLGCGRHALNNLFGAVYFTASEKAESYTIDEIKTAVDKLSEDNPLDLQRLCGYLFDHPFSGIRSVEDPESDAIEHLLCPDTENYNVTVLVAALRFLGYNLQIENLGKLSMIINQPDTFGILINTGGHWITVRKHNGEIYKLDSLIKSAEKISDIDNIRTKSIIVVKEFDEVYRKRYIGVEKMYNALRDITERASGRESIMNWVHSLQNLFPGNVQLLYDSAIKNIDDNRYKDIVKKLEELEGALDPYVENPDSKDEDIEKASKDSIQFNKELLELLGINGSPAGVGVDVGEKGDERAKLEKLYNSIADLETKIGDLEQAKVKSKVTLDVVGEEVDREPLGGIEVSDTSQAQDLSQLDGEDTLAQGKSIGNKDRDNKEIEMTELKQPAGALLSGRLVQAPTAAAAAAAAIPNRGINKDTSYNKPTKASEARFKPTVETVDFASSLRKGFGGNTRRRNRKTRHFQTLKNKKQ
jgi:hypothetical protein